MAEVNSTLLTAQEVKKQPVGSVFKGIFVVKSISRKSDKNGKPYWEITVSDTTGQLDAKVWSDAGWQDRSSASPVPLSIDDIPALRGKTLGINGKVSDFKGQLQFSFTSLSLLNQEKYPPANYIPGSPIALEVLLSQYEGMLGECSPEMSAFLRHVYGEKRWALFRDWPAAVSHHHAYAHGLLEHSLSVASLALAMGKNYRNPSVELDMDIIIGGALLHDLGKLQSYEMNPIPDVTLIGAVHDHVAIGYAAFMKIALEYGLNGQVRDHLAHIILSHHGQKEYGSPVLPATPEAVIVSYADGLDFHLFCWQDAVKDLAPDQPISPFHYGAQRRFWNRGDTTRIENE